MSTLITASLNISSKWFYPHRSRYKSKFSWIALLLLLLVQIHDILHQNGRPTWGQVYNKTWSERRKRWRHISFPETPGLKDLAQSSFFYDRNRTKKQREKSLALLDTQPLSTREKSSRKMWLAQKHISVFAAIYGPGGSNWIQAIME